MNNNTNSLKTVVFRLFVSLCDELKLLEKKSFAVDGAKIHAINSKKKSFTPEILSNKLAYLKKQEKKIEQYLSEMDDKDKEERVPGMDLKREEMSKRLEEIRERMVKYEGYQNRKEETGENQILETDPECRTIHTKEGLLPAYNIQAVVDDAHHLIASFKTTNANTDQGKSPSFSAVFAF